MVSDTLASAAGVFTTNLAKAAPVLLSHATPVGVRRARPRRRHQQRLRQRLHRRRRPRSCGEDGAWTAEQSAATPAGILVASTGVIGVKLDIEKVHRGIGDATAQLSPQGGSAAARAIMTTDPFPKESAVEVDAHGRSFRVGGMAKGSGMIEPLMATMLGVVTTDARVAPELLQRALKAAVDDTFNAITVDGECSTNDCVFALANGSSGIELTESDWTLLVDSLKAACEPLAIGIVRGGEGATKLVTVRVSGAASLDDARLTARAIANSLLVKTAIHGGDPNWGRLVAVAGRAGAAFSLERAIVRIGPVTLFADGTPYDERAPLAAAYLAGQGDRRRGRSRHRRIRCGADVDVRPLGRVRADQR